MKKSKELLVMHFLPPLDGNSEVGVGATSRSGIEINSQHDREEASRLLAKLRNLSSINSSGIYLDNKETMKDRDEAVMELARKLLGPDWDCMVKC